MSKVLSISSALGERGFEIEDSGAKDVKENNEIIEIVVVSVSQNMDLANLSEEQVNQMNGNLKRRPTAYAGMVRAEMARNNDGREN